MKKYIFIIILFLFSSTCYADTYSLLKFSFNQNIIESTELGLLNNNILKIYNKVSEYKMINEYIGIGYYKKLDYSGLIFFTIEYKILKGYELIITDNKEIKIYLIAGVLQ